MKNKTSMLYIIIGFLLLFAVFSYSSFSIIGEAFKFSKILEWKDYRIVGYSQFFGRADAHYSFVDNAFVVSKWCVEGHWEGNTYVCDRGEWLDIADTPEWHEGLENRDGTGERISATCTNEFKVLDSGVLQTVVNCWHTKNSRYIENEVKFVVSNVDLRFVDEVKTIGKYSAKFNCDRSEDVGKSNIAFFLTDGIDAVYFADVMNCDKYYEDLGLKFVSADRVEVEGTGFVNKLYDISTLDDNKPWVLGFTAGSHTIGYSADASILLSDLSFVFNRGYVFSPAIIEDDGVVSEVVDIDASYLESVEKVVSDYSIIERPGFFVRFWNWLLDWFGGFFA